MSINIVKTLIFTFLVMFSFSACKKKRDNINEVQKELELSFLRNYKNYTVKPILRYQKKILIELDGSDTFYVTNFNIEDDSELLISKDKNFSNILKDEKIKFEIISILKEMYKHNLIAISKDEQMIKFSTNVEYNNSGKMFVLLHCKDSLNSNSNLLYDKSSEIEMIQTDWYIYKSTLYSDYKSLEDFRINKIEFIKN